MILTSNDGRREIDLLPPAAGPAAAPLPEPVCPQGVVSASGEGFEDPPAPGESPLDAGLAGLRAAGVVGIAGEAGEAGDGLPEGGGS